MNGSLPSRLTAPLRTLLGAVVLLAGLVLADTGYLLIVRFAEIAAPGTAAETVSATRLFQVLLLAHSGLGVILVLLAVLFSVLHLRRVWARRTPAAIASGAATVLTAAIILVTGLSVLGQGARTGHRWIWWLHVIAGLAVPALYVVHRRRSVVRLRSSTAGRFAAAVGAAVVLLGAGHVVTRGGSTTDPGPAPGPAARASAAEIALERYGVVPPGYVSPLSPFFPSPATTGSGEIVQSAAVLGRAGTRGTGGTAGAEIGSGTCVRCHPDVTAQWEGSAHRFSSFNNPFYEASIRHLVSSDADGERKSRWCAGCHDPALLFTGRMDGSVDRSSEEARAGLTCLSCHGMQSLHDRTGNGNYTLRDSTPSDYVFSSATEPGWRRTLHDAALRARPDAHRRAMLPGFLRQADGCGTCHKVSLREPVNGYRWLRGQNELDAWEASGVSLEGAQTFYLPPERRVCQDCHMPAVAAPLGDLAADGGLVRSHRFLGANTALPSIRGDTATLRRVEDFLQSEIVTLDIFGYSSASGARSAMALPEAGDFVADSRHVFDVVVRNRGVGHAFPGGTIDSNEAWLEVRLLDADGVVRSASGALDADGRLDPGAHVFRALFVDSAGHRIARRNPQDIRATVYRNVVDPGSANLAHYRVRMPSEPGAYSLEVRLNWRKFDADYAAFTYAAVPEAFPGRASPPELPVTTIARQSFVLHVRAGTGAVRALSDSAAVRQPANRDSASIAGTEDSRPSWLRWNDFGIASLREGSTRNAAIAFGFVSSLAPDRPDGPINLARTALSDGDVATALEHLEEAARRAPAEPRIAWLRAEAELADGSYDLAAKDFERVLEAFPRHRLSLLGLGRAKYLLGEYESALRSLDALLAIDPESRPARYHKMLVLRSLGRHDEARAAEALVAYFAVDETAGRLTRVIRAEHPGVNTMAQEVRVHDLRPASP